MVGSKLVSDLKEIWAKRKATCIFCEHARLWYLTVGSGLRIQGRCEFGVQVSIGYSCNLFTKKREETRISMSIPTLLEIRRRLERRIFLERRMEKIKREAEEALDESREERGSRDN